jgi:D-glycero-D-manno-heptose 1,7-bisphosphate phosphatase
MAYSLAKETGQKIVILESVCDDMEEIKIRLKERRRSKDPLSEAKDISTYYSLKQKGDPITEEELEGASLVQVDTLWWRMRFKGRAPPDQLIQALELDKAVFLDRDGTIVKEPDLYVLKPEQLVIIKNTAKALRELRRDGWKVIVVTNQAGIGKGLLDEETLDVIHKRLMMKLKKSGAYLDKIYYCPHNEDAKCYCRKPSPGLLEKAIKDFALEAGKCWLIGNKETDIKAGLSSGIKSILVKTDKGINGAVDYILGKRKAYLDDIRIFYPDISKSIVAIWLNRKSRLFKDHING